MQRIIVCDTETTGVDDPILITEVAWCEVEDDLDIVEEFCTLVNPGVPIPCVASGISGIRTEDVVQEPSIHDIKFPDGEIIFIGHNTAYDIPLLSPYMNIISDICTLLLARRLLPNAPSHALSALSCYCGLPRQLSHRAYGDVRDCLGLLDFMMRDNDMNLQEIYDYYHIPYCYKYMPWGKHRGTKIQDLPSGYLKWLTKEPKLDKDMKYTLKTVFGIEV